MRVAIVGAGIMGASVAFHMRGRGADVHVFEDAPLPAMGVTRDAFGWVNTINGDPDQVGAFDLRLEAVEEYERLLLEVPELLAYSRRGSFVWQDTPEKTASFARKYSEKCKLTLVQAQEIRGREPYLREVPDLAVFLEQDFAIDPRAIVGSLTARAELSGVIFHYDERVTALEWTGQRIIGLRTSTASYRFDVVILTAGAYIRDLLVGHDVVSGLCGSPIVLLRYMSQVRFINNIISFNELEIRQGASGEVLVVEDYFDGCEGRNFDMLRKRSQSAISDTFEVPSDLTFLSGAVARRPVYSDGLPRRGFVADSQGLYVVVGHPGVILAPLLGRRTADEILAD